MKNHHQTVKDIPRTPQKKLQKHSIRLKHARGSNSKKEGAIINKNKKKTQESSGPIVSQSKPTDLMDPDQANAPGALD